MAAQLDFVGKKYCIFDSQICYVFIWHFHTMCTAQQQHDKQTSYEQVSFFNHCKGSEPMETLEDIYIGSIETDRGSREQVRFYDTRGLRDGMEFPRHYYTFADGFVLVYSIDSKESFKRMEALKKDIDRHRDKKEVRINPLIFMERFGLQSLINLERII